MKATLSVFQNGDDALLAWNVEETIEDCVGFAIRRELTRDGKKRSSWLDNFVGFSGEKHEDGERRPSTEWPFQGFSWTDHELSSGDSARYRVVPVLRDKAGKLERAEKMSSEWAEGRRPSSRARYRAFFNRGYVMSQFMAHYLEQSGKDLAEFKETIGREDDHTIRVFLAGDLRVAMLELLKKARTGKGEIYAALYELDDDELIDALVAMGSRAHVVLANGSITKKDGETTAEARKRDQNGHGRARLQAGSVDVEATNRFLSPGGLGHNKFLVLTDAAGKATEVWTGSTNWTPTGLCTQLNNGLLVRDREIAGEYLEQWRRLRKAASEFPKSLVEANSTPKSPRPDATLWFSKTSGKVDLAALREVVNSAKQGLLFLMFQPGEKGVIKDVLALQQEKPELFVRGVVSELPEPDDEGVVDITIVDGLKLNEHRLQVIEPEGRPNPFAWWAAETTHGQFKANVGYAIVHSKVLVVDPLTPHPTVVTGSHNFSFNASGNNDENFLVLRDDRALAEAYLVNVFGAWRHYRARAAKGSPYTGLTKDDAWMAGSLRAWRKQASFWGF